MKKLFLMLALVMGLGAFTSCSKDEPSPKHNFSNATVIQNPPAETEIYDCVRNGDDVIFTFNIRNEGEYSLSELRIAPPNLITLGPGGQSTTIRDNNGNYYNYAIVEFDGMKRSDSVVSGVIESGHYKQCRFTIKNVQKSASSLNLSIGCWTYPTNLLSRHNFTFENVKIY